MRYMLFLMVMMFANVAQALECQKLPDCASLGYSQDKDPNCADDGYMYCPFDQNYKVCVQYNCEALGFTESDKSTWCADLIKCKGNEKMTLCQKPCFATDYNSLKDLVESGHCKVVTMRDDITLPPNQGITLAANTIIDGGNHTLSSSSNKGYFNVFNLNNNSGFKNIFIKHNQSQMQQDQHIFNGTNDNHTMTLQNTQIEVLSNDKQDHVAAVFHTGTYEISGKFTVDLESKKHYLLSQTALKFKNADINVNIKGASGDAFVGNADFINSHGTITTEGVIIVYDYILTFETSNVHLNAQGSLLWTSQTGKYASFLLKDHAELKLTFKVLPGSRSEIDKLTHIKFETSTTAPAKLIIEGNEKLDSGDITASNTTDTLILNNVTCHPKKSGTTLLSEVQTSDNWTCVPY